MSSPVGDGVLDVQPQVETKSVEAQAEVRPQSPKFQQFSVMQLLVINAVQKIMQQQVRNDVPEDLRFGQLRDEQHLAQVIRSNATSGMDVQFIDLLGEARPVYHGNVGGLLAEIDSGKFTLAGNGLNAGTDTSSTPNRDGINDCDGQAVAGVGARFHVDPVSNTLVVTADLHKRVQGGGTVPHQDCSRTILRNVLQKLADTEIRLNPGDEFKQQDGEIFLPKGSKFRTGTEMEVFVIPKGVKREDIQMENDEYQREFTLKQGKFVHELSQRLSEAGINCEFGHKEVTGCKVTQAFQLEMGVRFEDADKRADDRILQRRIFNEVAEKHGYEIDFRPKPFKGVNGSGEHFNHSLYTSSGSKEDGDYQEQNLFAGKGGLSLLAKVFEAAMVEDPEITAALMAFTNPTLNSFARTCDEGMEASSYRAMCSNQKDRSVMSTAVNAPDKYMRAELRVMDPAANFYLAASAAIAVGIEGLKKYAALPPEERDVYFTRTDASGHKIVPDTDADLYEKANRDAVGIKDLPKTLAECVGALRTKSELFDSYLGVGVSESYGNDVLARAAKDQAKLDKQAQVIQAAQAEADAQRQHIADQRELTRFQLAQAQEVASGRTSSLLPTVRDTLCALGGAVVGAAAYAAWNR